MSNFLISRIFVVSVVFSVLAVYNVNTLYFIARSLPEKSAKQEICQQSKLSVATQLYTYKT
jgi:hypothetical protein